MWDRVLAGCRLCGGMGRVIVDEFNQALPGKAMPKACLLRTESFAGVWGVPSQRFQNIRKGYFETLLAG